MKKLPAHLNSQHEPCTNSTQKANAKIWWAALLLFTLFLFYLFLPSPSFAQDCGVTGTVTTSAGESVPNAFVAIHYPLGTLVGSAWTDSSGSYTISGLPCDVQLTEFVVCSGPFLDPGVKFGPIGSGIYTLNRTGIDCMIGPYPFPRPSPSPGPNPYPSLTCEPNCCSDTDSRPARCNICNLTYLKTFSCAQSFTTNDNVSFYWWEGQKCTAVTPEEYWVFPSWGGTVTVNPSQTTIPFVGKKGNEEEKLYLADYFEGTNEYYKNYGKYWLDWVNYAGVLRKLTPMEYQDELKKDIVQRAEKTRASGGRVEEGGIHDYKVEYRGRLCWDLPFLADLFLAIAKRYGLGDNPAIKFISDRAHYCAYSSDILPFGLNLRAIKAGINAFNAIPLVPNISTWEHMDDENATLTALNGHFPPEPDEENYLEKWQAWKKSKWGRLWETVPMVSREDTPGDILPYLGRKPKDTFEISNPESQIEKVPHVARLYEATKEINKIMAPFRQTEEAAQKEGGPIIASTKENVLGEKTLLAQTHQYSMDITPQITPQGENSYSVCWTFHAQANCGLYDLSGNLSVNLNGGVIYSSFWGPVPISFPYHCTFNPFRGPIPISAKPGDTITICANVTNLNHTCGGEDPRPFLSGCVSCKINPDGSTTCGRPVPEPTPVCGLPDAWPVNSCDQPAITDTNPNDELCCDPIKTHFTAIDSFNITSLYTKCQADPTLPECKSPKSGNVSRQVGINLFHPYLYEIWSQTANSKTGGIFNFFRPSSAPKFSNIAASSQINYSYAPGSVEPSVGKFYFPYLGGIQLAKQWLIQTLTPWK